MKAHSLLEDGRLSLAWWRRSSCGVRVPLGPPCLNVRAEPVHDGKVWVALVKDQFSQLCVQTSCSCGWVWTVKHHTGVQKNLDFSH